MKKYKKYMALFLTLLFVACLPANSIASEWRIGTPWKKVGPNVTLAVPTDRVGIGTPTPTQKLEVVGGSYHSILINTADLIGSGISFRAAVRDGRQYSILSTSHWAEAGVGRLGFFDDIAGAYRMIIDPVGNISIGTLRPTARLHVAGADSLNTNIAGNISGLTGTGLIITNANNVGIGITTPINRFHVAGTPRNEGGAQIVGLSIPSAPTVTPGGTPGTTTWGYRITARSLTGETLASAEGRTTSGNAILAGLNFNGITWTAVPGAVDYRVYRTTAGGTPSTTGLIGTTTLLRFDDAGLAATIPIPTIDYSSSVGIGTTTPATGNKLEVHDGHIVNTMTTPPIATCNIGTPSIIGTDMGGGITVPAGASTCTITFAIPWNQIYGCVVSSSVSGAHPFVPALSNTSATFNFTATPGATTALYYHCSGR